MDRLLTIQRLLNDKLNRKPSLFEETDLEAVALAEKYWAEMVVKKTIDASDAAYEKSKRMIDIDTLKHKDAREVGGN